MNAKQKIERLKTSLQREKEKRDQVQFNMKHCLQKLKDDYGCKSIAEAKKKVNTLLKKEEELHSKIEKQLQEVEHEYHSHNAQI